MKKRTYLFVVTLFIVMLVIASTLTISITNVKSIGTADNDDSIFERLRRLLTGEIIDADIAESAAINSSKIDGVPSHDHDERYYTQAEVDALIANCTDDGVINDVMLVWNETQSQYAIPATYHCTDTAILNIEDLPNLITKIGGTSQTLVETNVKRLVISVEAYADSGMDTFVGPCWTAPGALSEQDGKARWDLEFKNADGSSYAGTNWKLITVTTYLI